MKVKAPPTPSVLVVGNTDDDDKNKENFQIVEKKIMENRIPLQNTYRNTQGELCLVCDSKESRDKLNDIVLNTDINVQTKTPNGIRPSISIVGVPKDCSLEEITDMLVKQNKDISRFADTNSIHDHFKPLVVRPLKKDETKFQVFATISNVLREGFTYLKDKITIGLVSCKVYDQYHAKRCNKCQHYGHYVKDCPSDEQFCAKCGDKHATSTCQSVVQKCINCVRSGAETHDHYAYDSSCPSYKKEQERLKQRINKSNLNANRYRTTIEP